MHADPNVTDLTAEEEVELLKVFTLRADYQKVKAEDRNVRWIHFRNSELMHRMMRHQGILKSYRQDPEGYIRYGQGI